MDAIHTIEILVTYFVQGLGNWLLPVMQFFSFCASENFFMLIMPILYWCVDSAIGMRVGVVIMMSSSIVDIMKMAFHLPRPYWVFSKVKAFAQEVNFGLPSGHAQKAVAVWATMAASFRKTWLWVISIIMILMICLSRIYLGVHFLSDILAGLTISILFLFLYWKLEKPIVGWAKKQPLWSIALISLFICLIPIFICAVIRTTNAGWQPQPEWLVSDLDPFNLEGILSLNGTLFGLLVGYAWLSKEGGFSVKGTPLQLFLRYAVGIAGILAIQYWLKLILPEGDNFLGSSFRFIRYGVMGLWLSALAPFLFIRLKLSRKPE